MIKRKLWTILSLILASSSLLSCTSLPVYEEEDETIGVPMQLESLTGSSQEEEQKEQEEQVNEESYDKAASTEVNIRDNKKLYEDYDDYSVITMYLTVNEGNAADGSNHTWDEINYYSASEYAKMGVERYKVEGLLQIDETGEGVGRDSFGYGEEAPNVSVQVRGQTSSDSREQKNYKIRIKEGKGEFRGQRTLNLNKHRSEPFHFLNKLNYDMLNHVPQLVSARTQFVHLFVRDKTRGNEEEYTDYGLYTMVEQINKTYLRNHGLDEHGHLYKVTFFEWNEYDEIMVPLDDPDFELAKFEEYLEVKGDKDPTKLQEVIKKVQNYTIPIDYILEEHFDAENICYWMAFNILIGNQDVGARNLFLYSPLNSEKFYMICWDMDNSFKNNFNVYHERVDGVSWERGMSNFLGLTLIKRMMQEEKYRKMLLDAVEDIHAHYVTSSIVKARVKRYSEITIPYIYEYFCPDESRIPIQEDYERLAALLPEEVDDNYRYFKDTLDNPWPFYVDVPRIDESGKKMNLSWGISYDVNEKNITYSYILARDYRFTDVITTEQGLVVPMAYCDAPEPGIYFLRVIATNSSGKSADCFDYLSVVDYGKAYGCYCFVIEPDGSCRPYDSTLDGRFYK